MVLAFEIANYIPVETLMAETRTHQNNPHIVESMIALPLYIDNQAIEVI